MGAGATRPGPKAPMRPASRRDRPPGPDRQ